MRFAFGMVACLLAMPGWANESWRVVLETEGESVLIELDGLRYGIGQIGFRERHVMRDERMDPHSLRPVREVLAKRVADCGAKRIATVSRAVFSDGDALIDHEATRLHRAVWQSVSAEDPIFRQVCGSNASRPALPNPSPEGKGRERDTPNG